MRMRAGLVVAAAATLAACGSVAAPTASGPHARASGTTAASARRSPQAGSQAEATALARLMLSRLRLPEGARQLPPTPVPPSVREPALWVDAHSAIDVHRLFELRQPMATAAATLTAHVPAGLSLGITGGGSGGHAGTTRMEVAYNARPVPAGVYEAQLVLTIAPTSSGGSLVRADAQVVWFPPRAAAEYIAPARYHALRISVTILHPRTHTIARLVTSQAAITDLANALNQSEVQPVAEPFCPLIFASYQLAFAVSPHSRPVVVVSASQWPCGGVQISVGGRKEPSLQQPATVIATADRLLGVTPQP